jgi:hypothetical protein
MKTIVSMWYGSLTALEWPHTGIHLNMGVKVVESFLRKNMYPQNNMHHNSQRMTEDHPKYVVTSHP